MNQGQPNPFLLSSDAYEPTDTTVDPLSSSFEPVGQQPFKTGPPPSNPSVNTNVNSNPLAFAQPPGAPLQPHTQPQYSPSPNSNQQQPQYSQPSEQLRANDNTASYGSQSTTPPTSLWSRCTSCASFLLSPTSNISREYFDIDSIDIQTRIIGSVRYFNVTDAFWEKILLTDDDQNVGTRTGSYESPNDSVGEGVDVDGDVSGGNGAPHKPDAYGPFWITTTLIFLIAVSSNILQYAHHSSSSHADNNFEYDIQVILHAIWIVYGFAFGLPVFIYACIHCLLPPDSSTGGMSQSTQLSLMDVVCLYGYSFVSYLPAVALCGLIPLGFLAWVLLLFPTIVGCVFVLRNLVGAILGRPYQAVGGGGGGGGGEGNGADADLELLYATSAERKARGGPILGCIVASHLVFYLVLKLGFFRVV
mmetsp:Transcript_34268/g.41360  ORF Transcript_34268/g.41360 Transcript_34268/m.41360 type:complete len:418 (+) Transcript_34268:27-1280(+)